MKRERRNMKTKTSTLSIVLLAVMMIAGTAMADVLSIAELRESGEESPLAQFSSDPQVAAGHRYLSSDMVEVFESAISATAADGLSAAEFMELEEESRLAQFSSAAQATAAHRYLSSDTVDVFESAIVRTPEVADT
jgi:hypothetical protein